MRFVWMMVLTLGCDTKAPTADWDTGGSYTGWSDNEHADHDHDGDDGGEAGGEEAGGEEAGGEEAGGVQEGGEETDGDGGGDAVSCLLTADICIEPNEPNNTEWCEGIGFTASTDACPAGADGACAVPAGGDYTAEATVYYYNGFDGSIACEGAGGTYTAANGGDEASDDSDDTGW